MSKVRVLVGVLAVVFLTGGWLLGQDRDAPPVKAKGMLPPNWRKLGLSADQVQQVYRIQTDYRAKVAELEQQIAKLRKEERAAMFKVLTDAQKVRLREIAIGDVPETTTEKRSDVKKPGGEKK